MGNVLKGAIHMLEAVLSALLLLSLVLISYNKFMSGSSSSFKYDNPEIYSGNFSYRDIGIVKHVNKNVYDVNISRFPYVYVIYDGKIEEIYPHKSSLAYTTRINQTYAKFFVSCGSCSYDLIMLPYPLGKKSIKDIVFVNNSTGYMVIE